MSTLNPEHIDVDADTFKKSEPSENPVAQGLNITVSLPETVEIKMVDASTLSEYEVWFFICSCLCNAVVGYLVAYAQGGPNEKTYLINTCIFGILFFVACAKAFYTRHKLNSKTKSMKLRTTEYVG